MAILVVEDDPDLLDVLCFVLRRAGYDVITASDGAMALQLWQTRKPSLVLLDLDLPTLSGWEVCATIRKASTTPIIMLTASGTDTDAVKGLEAGADDYVLKPFSLRQLVARVQAVLRRSQGRDAMTEESARVAVADIVLDPEWRTVTRGGKTVRLTAIEFKLLHELVKYQGQVLTQERLADRVWGYEGVDDRNAIKGHIYNLRRKLEPDPSRPTSIRTVPGIGYTFPRPA